MKKSLLLLLCVSLLWSCKNEQNAEKSATVVTKKTNPTATKKLDPKDMNLSPEVAKRMAKIEKAKKAAKNRKPQPSLVSIIKGISKTGNFKPISEDKWPASYEPTGKSKRMLTSKKEENKNKWKVLKGGKPSAIEIDVETVLSMVMKGDNSDVKVTAFQFIDTETANQQEKTVKAIADYLTSTQSTKKHLTTHWQQNHIIYLFETRSAGFQEDMSKFVDEFKVLAQAK